MFRRTIISLAAVALMSSSVLAADIYDDGPVSYKDAPAYDPAFSWTGFYIGANVGYASGDYVADTIAGDITDSADFFEYDVDGFTGGAQLGYNWQAGQFVLGIEGDVGYLGVEGDQEIGDDLAETEFGAYGVLAGRLGFAYDKSLLYFKGGLVAAEVETTAGDTDGGAFDPNDSTTLDDTLYGYAIGGGVEHALSANWTLKAEYLYFNFDTETSLENDDPTTVIEHDTDLHTVKVGVNYKFGDRYEALK